MQRPDAMADDHATGFPGPATVRAARIVSIGLQGGIVHRGAEGSQKQGEQTIKSGAV
jgi:hypothetical protein